jgi:Holliday junction resolvasome RuvABC endonuclease subunit
MTQTLHQEFDCKVLLRQSVRLTIYLATQVQRLVRGGTYATKRQIAYEALKAAGYTDQQAAQALAEADAYFESIGVTDQTRRVSQEIGGKS